MPNNIELITKYASKAWDKVYKAESRSSLLDAKTGDAIFDNSFEGAKTVKIAKHNTGGMHNYYRANTPVDGNFGNGYGNGGQGFGYQNSDMSLTWETFTMRCDRAAKFSIELFDNDEVDGLAIGSQTTEVSRVVMIPEVDAYCFSEIYSHTSGALGNRIEGALDGTTATAANTPLKALNDAFLYFDEREVPAEGQIVFCSARFLKELRYSPELVKYLAQDELKKDVSFEILNYEGRKLVSVPPMRFNTKVTLREGGYTCDGDPIDFMVVARDAVVHVVKYNKVKIISGELNLASQNFDGYTIFTRIYHDLFVTENKEIALYAHTGGWTYSAAGSGKAEIVYELDGKKVKTLRILPAEKLVNFYWSTTAANIGDAAAPSGAKQIIPGANLTGTEGYIVAVAQEGVIACTEKVTLSA